MREDEWEAWAQNPITQKFRDLLEHKAKLFRDRRLEPREYSAEEFHQRSLESVIYSEAYSEMAEVLTLNYEDILFEEEDEPDER